MGGKRILIVGGGIAGLSLYNMLSMQRSHHIELLEKQTQLITNGTGITLGINTIKILKKLGLFDHIAKKGLAINRFDITNQAGKILSSLGMSEKMRQQNLATYAIHRNDLHQIFSVNLDPRHLQLGKTIDQIQPGNEQVEITFNDGSQSEYDLVFGADGIYSQTRKMLWPNSTLRYSGYSCWRCIIPANTNDRATEMWGKGKRLGIVPINANQSYVFLVINSVEGLENRETFSVLRMKSLYSEFSGPAQSVLDRLDHLEALAHNDLYDLPTPQLGDKRVLLLGDAAHAATPNLGQGASMAIEDAYRLSKIIHKASNDEDISPLYRSIRTPRVKRVIDMSYKFGRIAQWESTPAVALRNAAMRITPDRLNASRMEKFLLDY
ncbi:MAG: FAD-dependent monooxygenase [Gammaproteobacteria bacterium]|nr:FAD-dependent monooxygenase [Gammaproteobacteria bacterium]